MTFASLRLTACLALGMCCVQTPAHAAFETLKYGAEPLPFSLGKVAFSRPERRDAVSQAIREMTEAQLKFSDAFRKNAPTKVDVDLVTIETHGTVQPDGTGTGHVSTLYRVYDDNEHILLNDMIETKASVSVKDAIPLKQSTRRAARYRAFSQNIQEFLRAFGHAGHLPNVALAHDLETPERTQDFKHLIRRNIATLAPLSPPNDLTFLIRQLSIKQTTAKDAPTAAVKLSTEIALMDKTGQELWSGKAKAKARISTRTALQNGLNPLDTAIATAMQKALRQLIPNTEALTQTYTEQEHIAQGKTLPFKLLSISSSKFKGRKVIDAQAMATLKSWTTKAGPLVSTWQSHGKPIRIEVRKLKTSIVKEGYDATAHVEATYAVYGKKGHPLIVTHHQSSSPVSVKATPKETQHAFRVALLKNWKVFLDSLETLAPPLKTQTNVRTAE